MSDGLTPEQARLLRFVQREIDATGVCPSYDEMAEAAGYRSRSTAFRLVVRLEERGFVRRDPHGRRLLSILKRIPDEAGGGRCPTCGRLAP